MKTFINAYEGHLLLITIVRINEPATVYMCTNTIHVHRSSLHPVKIIDGLVFIFPIIIARVKKGDSPRGRGANKYEKLQKYKDQKK